MGTLNFPCPGCGAMVSTIGLAPGQAPACVSCGKTFAIPAPAHAGAGGGSSTSGVGAVMGVLVIAGIAVFLVIGFQRQKLAHGAMASAMTSAQQEADLERQIALLEDPDYNRVIQAWHGIYTHDRRDHWGTFAKLETAYHRTQARNCLWILTGGFCEFYDTRGEQAVTKALLDRRADRENFDLVCESLEQFPAQITRERGVDAGLGFVAKSIRILEAAQPGIDEPQSRKRLGAALMRLRAQVPAERR